MRQALQAGDRDHAPAIQAAITLAEDATATKALGTSQLSVWEWEGGQLRGREAPPDRARRWFAGRAVAGVRLSWRGR